MTRLSYEEICDYLDNLPYHDPQVLLEASIQFILDESTKPNAILGDLCYALKTRERLQAPLHRVFHNECKTKLGEYRLAEWTTLFGERGDHVLVGIAEVTPHKLYALEFRFCTPAEAEALIAGSNEAAYQRRLERLARHQAMFQTPWHVPDAERLSLFEFIDPETPLPNEVYRLTLGTTDFCVYAQYRDLNLTMHMKLSFLDGYEAITSRPYRPGSKWDFTDWAASHISSWLERKILASS